MLLLGLGAAIAPVPRAFREALEAVGIGVEPMSSPYFSMIVIPGEKWRG